MVNQAVGTQSLASEPQKKKVDRKLRVAVVGCGGISEVHLRVLQNFPDVEVVAGVDIKPERLDVMRDKFGIKKLYEDWRDMLKEVKPDAVDVCTPNGVHAPATIDALKAGCHVITEKPMAMNPAECEAMIKAAKDAGKVLVVGFQFRYHPATQMLVRAREAGKFGNIMFVKCQALRRRGIPNWGVFGRKEEQGSGPMIDIGVHVIEMAHYAIGRPKPVAATGNIWTYLGDKPSAVVCPWPGWDWKTYTVEDLAIGHVRFDNGAIMHIEASFAAHIERDVFNFSFIGEKGGGRCEPPAIFTDDAGTMFNMTPGFLPSADFAKLFDFKLRNFVDACLKGTPTDAPGEDGLVVQKIIDGVYRSAEAGGREVTID